MDLDIAMGDMRPSKQLNKISVTFYLRIMHFSGQ